MLSAVAVRSPPASACNAGDPGCPVSYPFWSSADGTLLSEIVAPKTGIYASLYEHQAFSCSSTSNVCAGFVVDRADLPSFRTTVYRSDGAVLARFPTDFVASLALSPDGLFVATSGAVGFVSDIVGESTKDDRQLVARVYRIADGALVATRRLVGDIF
jgi:hypothetical protein